MKEFHNTDPVFKDYKYAYGEPKESKTTKLHNTLR